MMMMMMMDDDDDDAIDGDRSNDRAFALACVTRNGTIVVTRIRSGIATHCVSGTKPQASSALVELRASRFATTRASSSSVDDDTRDDARDRSSMECEHSDDDGVHERIRGRSRERASGRDRDARANETREPRRTTSFGAFVPGAECETSSSTAHDATWRVGVIEAVRTNVAPRVVVKYGDGTREFATWSPRERAGDASRAVASRGRDGVKCFVRVRVKELGRGEDTEGRSNVANDGATTGARENEDGERGANANANANANADAERGVLRGPFGGREVERQGESTDVASTSASAKDDDRRRAREGEDAKGDDAPAAKTSADVVVLDDGISRAFPSSARATRGTPREEPMEKKRKKRMAAVEGACAVPRRDDDAEPLTFTSCAWARFSDGRREADVLSCGSKSGHVVTYVVARDDLRMTVLHTARVSSNAWVTALSWAVDAEDASLFVGLSDGSVIQASGASANALKASLDVARDDANASAWTHTRLFDAYERIADVDGAAVTCVEAKRDSATSPTFVVAGKANGDVFIATLENSRMTSWIKRVSLEPVSGAVFARGGMKSNPTVVAYVVSGGSYVALDVPNAAADDVPIRESASTRLHNAAFTRTTVCSIGAAASPDGAFVVRFDAFAPLHKLPNLRRFKDAKCWRAAIDVRSFSS